MKKLKKYRILAEKSQGDLAEVCGVSTLTISFWERGLFNAPDIQKVKLADYFSTTVQELFFSEELSTKRRREVKK